MFDTIGGHSAHKHDQYLLTMINGAISWSHNDQNDKQLFKVTTDPIVTESKCLFVVVVVKKMDVYSGHARIFQMASFQACHSNRESY